MPSATFTEQNGLFANLEGRLQKSIKSTFPPGDAKEDWKIFNLISKKINNIDLFKNFVELSNDTLKRVKNFSELNKLPKLNLNKIEPKISNFISENITIKEIDYYFSNSIARSSKTMSDCRAARSKKIINKTGS